VTLVTGGVEVALIRKAFTNLKKNVGEEIELSSANFNAFKKEVLGQKQTFLDKKSVKALLKYRVDEIEEMCRKVHQVYQSWVPKRDITSLTLPVIAQLSKADKSILAYCTLNKNGTVSEILPKSDTALGNIKKTYVKPKISGKSIRSVAAGVDNYNTGLSKGTEADLPSKLYDDTLALAIAVVNEMASNEWNSVVKNIPNIGLGKKLSDYTFNNANVTGEHLRDIILTFTNKTKGEIIGQDSELIRNRGIVGIALYVVGNLRVPKERAKKAPKIVGKGTKFNSFTSSEKPPTWMAKSPIKKLGPNPDYDSQRAEEFKRKQENSKQDVTKEEITNRQMVPLIAGFLVHKLDKDGNKTTEYAYKTANEVLDLIFKNDIVFKSSLTTSYAQLSLVEDESGNDRIAVDTLFSQNADKLVLSVLALDEKTINAIGYDTQSIEWCTNAMHSEEESFKANAEERRREAESRKTNTTLPPSGEKKDA